MTRLQWAYNAWLVLCCGCTQGTTSWAIAVWEGEAMPSNMDDIVQSGTLMLAERDVQVSLYCDYIGEGEPETDKLPADREYTGTVEASSEPDVFTMKIDSLTFEYNNFRNLELNCQYHDDDIIDCIRPPNTLYSFMRE